MLKLQPQRQTSAGRHPVLALITQLAPQPWVLARGDLQTVVEFQLNIPELPIVISFIVSCSWLVHISGLLVFQARTVYP